MDSLRELISELRELSARFKRGDISLGLCEQLDDVALRIGNDPTVSVANYATLLQIRGSTKLSIYTQFRNWLTENCNRRAWLIVDSGPSRAEEERLANSIVDAWMSQYEVTRRPATATEPSKLFLRPRTNPDPRLIQNLLSPYFREDNPGFSRALVFLEAVSVFGKVFSTNWFGNVVMERGFTDADIAVIKRDLTGGHGKAMLLAIAQLVKTNIPFQPSPLANSNLYEHRDLLLELFLNYQVCTKPFHPEDSPEEKRAQLISCMERLRPDLYYMGDLRDLFGTWMNEITTGRATNEDILMGKSVMKRIVSEIREKRLERALGAPLVFRNPDRRILDEGTFLVVYLNSFHADLPRAILLPPPEL